MARYRTYKCDKCHFEYSPNGPHLFYHNNKGEIEFLTHPWFGEFPVQIEGAIFFEYCMDCKKMTNFIFSEKTNDIDNELDFYVDLLKAEDQQIIPYCSVCGGHNMSTFEDPFKGSYKEHIKIMYQCPRCGEKSFHYAFEMWT